MKKIHLLLVLFLSLIFLLACEEKEEIIPSPKLEITVTPGVSIPVGSSVTFIFKVENLKTLKVNGEQIPFNSSTFSLPVQNIEANTTFVFRGIGENGDEVEKSVTITTYTVIIPKPSLNVVVLGVDAFDEIYCKDKVTINIITNAPFTVNGQNSSASFVVQPEKDTTFIVEATNTGGTSKDTVIIRVKPHSTLLFKPTYWQIDSSLLFIKGAWEVVEYSNPCTKEEKLVYKPKQYLSGRVEKQALLLTTTCFGQLETIREEFDLIYQNNEVLISYQWGTNVKIISLTANRLETLSGDGSNANLFIKRIYKAHYLEF